MLKAMWRYLRAVGYFLTGRVDSARKELSRNPYVVRATYDKIVEEKTKRINQYKEAVAALIAQEEKKVARVRQLTNDVSQLEQLKEGAAAKARQVVQMLQAQGESPDDVKQDPEYLKCLTAFNDFSSTLSEKNDHIAELEEEVRTISGSIGSHKIQLQQLLRELNKIKEEAAEAVADVITAREEQDIADMLTGISEDSSSRELQEMRDTRQQMKAEARISRELAGTDTKRQEAEFLEYARQNVANSEFERLIGLAQRTDAGTTDTEGTGPVRLPEG